MGLAGCKHGSLTQETSRATRVSIKHINPNYRVSEQQKEMLRSHTHETHLGARLCKSAKSNIAVSSREGWAQLGQSCG